MLPIIRRIRHPLLPSDSPVTASVGQCSVGVPHASSRSVPALPPAPSEGRVGSPSTPQSDSPKTENRSDFGQKRSDSDPATPHSASCAPLFPWSLQPNEAAADYQLFAAWLQLPSPRRFRNAASALGCSLYRLRRLSARHHWKTRAAAFDNDRANAASRALEELVRAETSDWKERVERFRHQEWLLHEDMLRAASEAARQLQKHPSRASLNDLIKLYELASVLGRRACGMPLEPPAAANFEPPFLRPEFEAALDRIYGPSDACETAQSAPQSVTASQ